MNFEVELTVSAQRDLDRLEDFLAENSGAAAQTAIKRLEEAIDSLGTMPERGRLKYGGRRELVVPFGRYSYLLSYRVTPKLVLVLRIRHSKEAR